MRSWELRCTNVCETQTDRCMAAIVDRTGCGLRQCHNRPPTGKRFCHWHKGPGVVLWTNVKQQTCQGPSYIKADRTLGLLKKELNETKTLVQQATLEVAESETRSKQWVLDRLNKLQTESKAEYKRLVNYIDQSRLQQLNELKASLDQALESKWIGSRLQGMNEALKAEYKRLLNELDQSHAQRLRELKASIDEVHQSHLDQLKEMRAEVQAEYKHWANAIDQSLSERFTTLKASIQDDCKKLVDSVDRSHTEKLKEMKEAYENVAQDARSLSQKLNETKEEVKAMKRSLNEFETFFTLQLQNNLSTLNDLKRLEREVQQTKARLDALEQR